MPALPAARLIGFDREWHLSLHILGESVGLNYAQPID